MDRWLRVEEVPNPDNGGTIASRSGARFTPLAGCREAVLMQEENVCLYDGSTESVCNHGILVITTHRLIWLDLDLPRIYQLPLQLVSYTKFVSKSLFNSPKVALYVQRGLTNRDGSTVSPFQPTGQTYTQLSFRSRHSDRAKQGEAAINQALQQRTWETNPLRAANGSSSAQQTTTSSFSSSSSAHNHHQQQVVDEKEDGALAAYDPTKQNNRYVGLSGIIRMQHDKLKTNEVSIREAFGGDLVDLQEKAKALISLTESYLASLNDGSSAKDDSVLSAIAELGIANPITKAQFNSSSKYVAELAKELAPVFEHALEATTGMMLVADAYCVANRARGVDLVSPKDVRAACGQMEQLGLPIRMRTFKSGVDVIELRTMDEENLARRVLAAIRWGGRGSADGAGVRGKKRARVGQKETMADVLEGWGMQDALEQYTTASRLAAFLGKAVSVVLATEMLAQAQQLGHISCDSSIEGNRYYRNLLLSAPPSPLSS